MPDLKTDKKGRIPSKEEMKEIKQVKEDCYSQTFTGDTQEDAKMAMKLKRMACSLKSAIQPGKKFMGIQFDC